MPSPSPNASTGTAPGRTGDLPETRTRRGSAWDVSEIRWAAAALVLFTAGGLCQLTGAPAATWWALYLACYFIGGWQPAWDGLRAARARSLDVDLLMIVAAVTAAAIGQILDGALLIVIFATSGALEALATRRTEDSVRSLLRLAPERATRLDADGTERVVPIADLHVDDVVLVRPGETIGADAVVVDGASDVDQSAITGEPLPVAKERGGEVFAGTLNGTGALRIRVTRAAGDSVVARIVAMVEQASATKADTQLFIEKVEQRYSAGVVVATLALFFVPLALGEELRSALLRAMTFMIVASPCAVVLATMPPLLAAIANAGRHGVLVKSAVAMERLAQVDLVAFDKTGTLTRGTPVLVAARAVPGAEFTDRGVLSLAASAERPSEHPVAAAVVRGARDRGAHLHEVTDFEASPGRGVRARLGSRALRVGAPRLLTESKTPAGADILMLLAEHRERGETAVVVLVDDRPVGILAVVDEVRPEAPRAVAEVARRTVAAPILLTGDDWTAARRVAGEVGIGDSHAELLPADKAERVRSLRLGGRTVAVIGDGINDAPALATADVGIAMGRVGSDLALRTADVVVVRDDLDTVPAVLGLARRARRVVIANLVIAATVIAVLVGWDLAGDLPLPLGVAGHEGSTVLVGLNGLRLLRASAWRRAARPNGGAAAESEQPGR